MGVNRVDAVNNSDAVVDIVNAVNDSDIVDALM